MSTTLFCFRRDSLFKAMVNFYDALDYITSSHNDLLCTHVS